jgi:hypothetical protein
VEEEAQFGVQGTLYDFTSYTYEVGRREISQRKDRSKVLLQTVNPKAMSLLNTAEQKVCLVVLFVGGKKNGKNIKKMGENSKNIRKRRKFSPQANTEKLKFFFNEKWIRKIP